MKGLPASKALTASLLILLLAFALLPLPLLPGCGGKKEAGKEDDLTVRARAMVEALASGDYATPLESFDAAMRENMPEEALKQTWESLQQVAGPLQEITGTRTEEIEGYRAVFLTCRFEAWTLDIKVVFNQEGMVAGFFYLPDQRMTEYQPPEYVDVSSFSEREVTVENGEWRLPGTLTVPNGEGPFPGLVLVHGSGPNNRDEGGGPSAPFKDLAWGLASRGIAVLRYDKRTLVYQDELTASGGMITVQEETVDDAVAAVELLLLTPEVDPARVFVLGHSLGGMLIPRIAAACPRARGFIVMAGPARPFEDLIYEQTEYILGLDGEIDAGDRLSLAQLRQAVARVKDPGLSPDTPGTSLPLGGSGMWWISVRDIKPVDEARLMDRPLLVIQGERDYQVTMVDFSMWREALSGKPEVTLKSYPDLNHIFFTGTGKSTPQEYGQPGHVSGEAVEDIARFILE
jgi:fermentation-respiration switch protein FrsA (DUF1100 family)